MGIAHKLRIAVLLCVDLGDANKLRTIISPCAYIIAASFLSTAEDGVTKGMKTSIKEAIALLLNRKIILLFNKELKLIGQATRLLSDFLGSLGTDYSQFHICEESWKIQIHTYAGGSKTLARRKDEEEKLQGKPIRRGELWTTELIVNIESQDESSKQLSQNDSLAQVLGKEHPGRVHALGVGPCPTQLSSNTTAKQSDSDVRIEEYQRTIV
ncbi:hypothetical protein Ahy_A03g013185 [Arachis hypogaea]|uniref:Uncharacterized protein n=1 Tax=Arachis hypogaea TaxID=3818 RepID=A0A445DUY6_ARAHY|nr:hypothetical protein Ahy_A03g013185 [Arachis hypogaea]